MSSEDYGLPGVTSKKYKKNFSLLAEVLQVFLSVFHLIFFKYSFFFHKCFGTRNTFPAGRTLNFLNGFITANQDRMDQFVQTMSLPVKQVPETAIPVEFTVTDYQMMERLLTNVNVVVALLKPADVPSFTKLAQDLQFYRALELFNSDNLTDQPLKLRVIVETTDHAFESEIEGPGIVVGTLVPSFLKSMDGAKKKIGKKERTSAVSQPQPSKVFGSFITPPDSHQNQNANNPTQAMPKFIQMLLQEIFLRGFF